MLNISNIDSVLSKYNLYYRSLSSKGKKQFNSRIQELSKQINILGRDFEVSEEIRIILYGYFVQMTFGFQNFIPGNYSVIHLFENTFHSKNNQKELDGKTFSDKIIALSWYHFSKSHLISNDGENLGFFHIGQALVQSLLKGNSSDDRFCSYFDPCAIQVFEEINKKRTHTLYSRHQDEIVDNDFRSFFPYLMEWFFEKPIELKKELPNTYAHLCVLMNQDPLAFESDYALDQSKYQNKKGINPLPKKITKNFAYYRSHWLYNLPLVCIIFLPVFYTYYVRHHILLTNLQIVEIYVALSVFVFLGLNHFFVGRKLFKTQFWYAIFVLTGLAPALLFSAFFIGFNFPLQTETSTHQIAESQTVIGQTGSRGSGRRHSYIKYFEVYFKDQFLNEFPESREFYPEDQPKNPAIRGAFASYEIGRSIFGFKVVMEKFILDISVENNIH